MHFKYDTGIMRALRWLGPDHRGLVRHHRAVWALFQRLLAAAPSALGVRPGYHRAKYLRMVMSPFERGFAPEHNPEPGGEVRKGGKPPSESHGST